MFYTVQTRSWIRGVEAVGWSVLVQVSEVGRGRVMEAILAAGQGHRRASTQQKNQYLLLGVRRNRRGTVRAVYWCARFHTIRNRFCEGGLSTRSGLAAQHHAAQLARYQERWWTRRGH